MSSIVGDQRLVVHLPVYYDNPYQKILIAAQRKRGWQVVDGGGGGDFFGTAWRDWRTAASCPVLHVHWLHPYLLRQGVVESWLRGGRFLLEINMLKAAGFRIVWTVHNLVNHDRLYPKIDLQLTRMFARVVDVIVVHGIRAVRQVQEHFRVPVGIPIVDVPHPNYSGHLPPAEDRSEARQKLNLADRSRVLLFLGRIQHYKCVGDLIDGFATVLEPAARLLIVGCCSDDRLAKELRRRADNDARVRLELGHVPDDRVGLLMGAADVVCCPSRGQLTSGSLTLADSYGKPVVAPNAGAFGYDPQAPATLRVALDRAMTSPPEELLELGLQATRRAASGNPDLVAAQLIELYESIDRRRIFRKYFVHPINVSRASANRRCHHEDDR